MELEPYQQTLDGRNIPVMPQRKEVHLYVSPKADRIGDNAKAFLFTQKGMYFDACIVSGDAIRRIMPLGVFLEFPEMSNEEILQTIYQFLIEHI